MTMPPPLDDTAARHDPAAFAEEQARLGRVWTFLGFAVDVRDKDQWFRAALGGRSVIVQRFEKGLSGFENRCAHRGFPLRAADKGKGALVCAFHHWRYNAEGLALGIPECPAMFGVTPRELDARLGRIELAECGGLIFGRFPGGDGLSLEEWLGPAFPIVAHLSSGISKPAGRYERVVQSNWRYMMDISLDDYHIVAVHPTTFGKEGYLKDEAIRYARFGAHSAYLPGKTAETLEELAARCADGSYRPRHYRILQLFPTLIVSVARAANVAGDSYCFLVLQHFIPEAHDRTRTISRFFPLKHKSAGPVKDAMRAFLWHNISIGFQFFARRVHKEDNEVCETLQANARRDDPPSRIARQEERIAWFSDSYVRVLAGETMAAREVTTNRRD